MKRRKLETILNDLNNYKDYNFRQGIDERLKKTLQRYVDEIDNSYLRLKVKNALYISKRLSR